MVTPRTARYLLLGIVAACISATATLAAVDAGRPVAAKTAVTQPTQFQIPSYAPGNDPSIINASGQSATQGNGVTLLPSSLTVTPAVGPAG